MNLALVNKPSLFLPFQTGPTPEAEAAAPGPALQMVIEKHLNHGTGAFQ
jgi:hypothetical protein